MKTINNNSSPLKSTSPTSLVLPGLSGSGILLIPTSMTTTPSFTMSAVIRFGFPAAATMMSAVLVNTFSCSGGVYLWQMVVVASPAMYRPRGRKQNKQMILILTIFPLQFLRKHSPVVAVRQHKLS